MYPISYIQQSLFFIIISLIPVSIVYADTPCDDGWKPSWNSGKKRWQCVSHIRGQCNSPRKLTRRKKAPFTYYCKHPNPQVGRTEPRTALKPSCPSSTKFIATSGQCIGLLNLTCPSGYKHAQKVVKRKDRSYPNDIDLGQPYKCVKVKNQPLGCHPKDKSITIKNYQSIYHKDGKNKHLDICQTYLTKSGKRKATVDLPGCRINNKYSPSPWIIHIRKGEDLCVEYTKLQR